MSKRVHNKKRSQCPKHWPSAHRTKVRAPDRQRTTVRREVQNAVAMGGNMVWLNGAFRFFRRNTEA